MGPTIHSIAKSSGVAGQIAFAATVEYEGEPRDTVTFVGSVYSGPVVMVTSSGTQTFVTEPSRFGETLTAEWVRRFFS